MLMLEMYHGKSLAFKDLSMSCAARILEYFLEKADSTVTLLIGIFYSNMRFFEHQERTQLDYNVCAFVEPAIKSKVLEGQFGQIQQQYSSDVQYNLIFQTEKVYRMYTIMHEFFKRH